MRASVPPRASATALSFATSSSTLISLFCRNTCPSRFTEMVSGSRSWSSALAWLCGRSSGTPTVSSGAETMNTMSSTSMTSTNGVTLISLITACRRRLCLPVDAALTTGAAMFLPLPVLALHAFVDLPRQDRREFVGEAFEALRLAVHVGLELIIENRRRDGGDETDRGREQRLGDAGRDHCERSVLGGRNRLEARHDAPDRAEQANEGTCRADRRQHQKPPLHVFDFAGDGDIHDLLDARLQPGKRAGMALEAPFPFAHGGDKQRRGRMTRLGCEGLVEILQGLPGPECWLEAVGGPADARE